MSLFIGIEVKLKRSPSRKSKLQKQKQPRRYSQKQRQDFPPDWTSHSIGYDSLKYHLREYDDRKRVSQGMSFLPLWQVIEKEEEQQHSLYNYVSPPISPLSSSSLKI